MRKEPNAVLGKDIDRKLELFEKNIEKKMETFEHKIKNFNLLIGEKNSKISYLDKRMEEKEIGIKDLEKRLDVTENKFAEVSFEEINNKLRGHKYIT